MNTIIENITFKVKYNVFFSASFASLLTQMNKNNMMKVKPFNAPEETLIKTTLIIVLSSDLILF